MLKREVLEVLRGRDVIVYPDEDAAQEWTEKLRGMADIANFVVADVSGFGKKGGYCG